MCDDEKYIQNVDARFSIYTFLYQMKWITLLSYIYSANKKGHICALARKRFLNHNIENIMKPSTTKYMIFLNMFQPIVY